MISKEEIKNLAELARLELAEEETISLQKDISNILGYVSQVAAAGAGEELNLSQNRNVMRDDMPRAAAEIFAGKEEVLRAAFPRRKDDYNSVRKIIQKDE